MSLRIFHIVFIVASFGLSLFVALWAFRGGSVTLGIVFTVAAVALIAYSFHAFRLLKDVDE